MSDKLKEIMYVPIGTLLQYMMPTELASLAEEAIRQGIVKGRQNKMETRPAVISLENTCKN